MLTESFFYSTAAAEKATSRLANKDAGIFEHQLQPAGGQQQVYNRSATAAQCLAVSDSHVFAAQEHKAVVHVYERQKSSAAELAVFPDRICCLAVFAHGQIVVLGTAGGRILLWEVLSGRVASSEAAHLQPVSAVAVDPTGCFVVSGSEDSYVYSWRVGTLLSFRARQTDKTPAHALEQHLGGVTAVCLGHSQFELNICCSASRDRKICVWQHRTGELLRVIDVAAVPLALVLDPADRAVHAAFDDGSLQTIDFYHLRPADDRLADATADTTTTTTAAGQHLHPLYDRSRHVVAVLPARDTVLRAPAGQELGPALALDLSWDATTLLSGHACGRIASWDVAAGLYRTAVVSSHAPVSNLLFTAPRGLPAPAPARLAVVKVIKPNPKLAAGTVNADFAAGEISLPREYQLVAALAGHTPLPAFHPLLADDADEPLPSDRLYDHVGLPSDVLESAIAELADWKLVHEAESPADGDGDHAGRPNGKRKRRRTRDADKANSERDADFVAFDSDDQSVDDEDQALREENERLRAQVDVLQTVQKTTFDQLAELRKGRHAR